MLEVVKGYQKVQRQPLAHKFIDGLTAIEVLPVDVAAAVIAGRIYGDLERTGQPIGRADPMIAGVAIANGLPLVTGNVSHYQRIIDLGYALELENWHIEPMAP